MRLMTRPSHRERPPARAWRAPVLVVAALIVVATAAIRPSPAHAVSAQLTIVPTPASAGSYAEYAFGTFSTANRETATQVSITFPPECDISAAAAVNPGDTILSRTGSTVVLRFGTPIPQRTDFNVLIGNVRNPLTAGTYTLPNTITFRLGDGSTQTLNIKPARRLDFTIAAPPYIFLTIETPDPLQTVSFGAVDPGVAAPSRSVTLTVDASDDFTISKTVTGQVALMGLTWSALPGGLQLAGVRTFVDTFQMTPPWSTDPGAYTANVTYTVVLN